MNDNRMIDERVILTKRKIQSDGFQIVWFVLLISVLIQQYLYNAPFTQYAVEIFILIAMSVYILIANIVKGNDVFTSKKRGQSLIMIQSLIAGATVAIINTLLNYMNYSDKIQHPGITHMALVALISFVCSTALTLIILEFFFFLNHKRQETINKELNNDDSIE